MRKCYIASSDRDTLEVGSPVSHECISTDVHRKMVKPERQKTRTVEKEPTSILSPTHRGIGYVGEVTLHNIIQNIPKRHPEQSQLVYTHTVTSHV